MNMNIDGFTICNGVLESYLIIGNKIVTIPEGVTVIGENTFKGFASIEEIVLPQTLTSIMRNAFKGCRKLVKINFPESLSYIGEYAFHRCHALETVVLPRSVTKLRLGCFSCCENLKQVEMPGVTKLSKQTFLLNEKLAYVMIPDNFDISCLNETFNGSTALSEIAVCTADGNTTKYQLNGVELLRRNANSQGESIAKAIVTDAFRAMKIDDGVLERFLVNLKHVTIPEGITVIGKSCFFDKKGIISIKLPSTLWKIDNHAFRNCNNLEKITFTGTNEVEVSEDAFRNCTTLNTVDLNGQVYKLSGISDERSEPPAVEAIRLGVLAEFVINGTMLVKYRGSEERVTVPHGITVIGERAFWYSRTIDRIILPETLTTIEYGAFDNCTAMQSINIPQSVVSIGKRAFDSCTKLIRIELPEKLEKIENDTFNGCKSLREVHFGGVRQIGDNAFQSCTALEEVRLPDSLVSIGKMVFYKCTALTEVTLPKSIQQIGSNAFSLSGVRRVEVNCCECGSGVFSRCSDLSHIVFAEDVTEIAEKFAFECKALETVELPSQIESVGAFAFEETPYLENILGNAEGIVVNVLFDGRNYSGDVIIPGGVKVIADKAFYANETLTSVFIPDSVTFVGREAFSRCTALRRVRLSENVTQLYEGAFSYCDVLETVEALNVTEVGSTAFYNCKNLKSFSSERVEEIGEHAFTGCDALDGFGFNTPENIAVNPDGSLYIPEGVTRIAPYAFAKNTDIKVAVFPTTLTKIESGAFWGCKNLKEVYFNSELELIGDKAFEKCTSLIEFYAVFVQKRRPAPTIYKRAFSFCTSLKNVHLVNTVVIGEEVFFGCSALKKFHAENLRRIEKACFKDCKSLDSRLDLRDTWYIGEYAFAGCDSLNEVTLNPDVEISSHAFEDCTAVQKIKFPFGTEKNFKYASYSFSGCTALDCIEIKGRTHSITDSDAPDLVKHIHSNALSCFDFADKTTITAYHNNGRFVKIPDTVTAIGDNVFKDCMDLEEIVIPESVNVIGSRAFLSTPWLERQKAESPMVVINEQVVDGTLCVGDVVIPPSLKAVCGWAFANCFALTSVEFSSKTLLGEYAFRNCINLKYIIMDGVRYSLNGMAYVHEDLPEQVKQIFHDCLNCFKVDENGLLFECTGNITTLVLPKGIRGIGKDVFRDCNLLTHIVLTDEVQFIDDGAFELSKWLVSVRGGRNVTRIGKRAFRCCYALETVEFSAQLVSIGKDAFAYTKIKEVGE